MKKKGIIIVTGILVICALAAGMVLFIGRMDNNFIAAMFSSGDKDTENRMLTTAESQTQTATEATVTEVAQETEAAPEVSEELVAVLEKIDEKEFSDIRRGNDNSSEKQYVEVNLSGVDASLFSKRNVLLPVNFDSQLPELPTGCEITALTTVLNYWGYSVSKETMADNYLPKCDIQVGDFLNYFLGDPYTDYSFVCYANPIVVAANRYFSNNGCRHVATNFSGSDFSSILKEVENGNPVVIWSTYERKEAFVRPEFTWELASGQSLTWISPEHCVALIGYDLDAGTVTLSDPLEGIVTCDLSVVDARYRQLASQAVAIRAVEKKPSEPVVPGKNETTTATETKKTTAETKTTTASTGATDSTKATESTTAATTKSTVQETTKSQ